MRSRANRFGQEAAKGDQVQGVLLMPRQPIDPKRTGVKATLHVFGEDDVGTHQEPGAMEIQDGFLLLACPGCGYVSGMSWGYEKPARQPSWKLTGDITKPETISLTPSINCVNCCGWHAHLTNGVFG